MKDQYEGQSPADGVESPRKTESDVGKVTHRTTTIDKIQGEQPCGEGPYDPNGGKYSGGRTSKDQD